MISSTKSATTIAPASRRRRGSGRGVFHQRRQPHVLAAAQGDDGAEHRQPQEEDRGEFVRPHERRVEDVARHDAAEQDGDLDDDQYRRRHLGDPREDRVEPGEADGCRCRADGGSGIVRPPQCIFQVLLGVRRVCRGDDDYLTLKGARSRSRLAARRGCRYISPATPRPPARTSLPFLVEAGLLQRLPERLRVGSRRSCPWP